MSGNDDDHAVTGRTTNPAVVERLGRLASDQRAAATAPPGPVLCVAPAGSGKTTTLVARVAWLVDGGADPETICVVAFNRRAAEELTARLDGALEPLGWAAGSVRVRTFHALGRELLAEAGVSIDPLIDRDALLRALIPQAGAADRGRLDLAFSRLKLDLRVSAEEVAGDPAPGPVASAFVAYERAIAELERRGLRRPRGPGAPAPPGRSGHARPLAGAVRPPAGGRGAGPRPDAAGARAAPRGAGQQRVPGRRRRPDHLRLAAGGRATGAGSGGLAARAAARRPRDQLPVPAAGRRASRAPRRAQPGALRQADPGRPASGGEARPRTRRVPTTWCG